MEITFFLITFLILTERISFFVAADSLEEAGSYENNSGTPNNVDVDSYEDDGGPKEYSSEEKTNKPDYNDSGEQDGEGQPTDLDVNDKNMISILNLIIDDIHTTGDPTFE